jgi:hypothetical protein
MRLPVRGKFANDLSAAAVAPVELVARNHFCEPLRVERGCSMNFSALQLRRLSVLTCHPIHRMSVKRCRHKRSGPGQQADCRSTPVA